MPAAQAHARRLRTAERLHEPVVAAPPAHTTLAPSASLVNSNNRARFSSRSPAPAPGRSRTGGPRRRAALDTWAKCAASSGFRRSSSLGASSTTACVPGCRNRTPATDGNRGARRTSSESSPSRPRRVVAQLVRVGAARVGGAEAAQPQAHALGANPLEAARTSSRIDSASSDGSSDPIRLHAHLVELALGGARLRRLVAERRGPSTRASPAAAACACRARDTRGTPRPCPPGAA